MSVYKRGKTFWTDFSVNGQRYRESLGTSDWRQANARQKELITQASQGKVAPTSQQFGKFAFSEAADRLLIDRIPHLAVRSIQTDKERSKPLKEYFCATPLSRISADHIRRYIAARKEAGLRWRSFDLMDRTVTIRRSSTKLTKGSVRFRLMYMLGTPYWNFGTTLNLWAEPNPIVSSFLRVKTGTLIRLGQ
jgi:hypothetical protein